MRVEKENATQSVEKRKGNKDVTVQKERKNWRFFVSICLSLSPSVPAFVHMLMSFILCVYLFNLNYKRLYSKCATRILLGCIWRYCIKRNIGPNNKIKIERKKETEKHNTWKTKQNREKWYIQIVHIFISFVGVVFVGLDCFRFDWVFAVSWYYDFTFLIQFCLYCWPRIQPVLRMFFFFLSFCYRLYFKVYHISGHINSRRLEFALSFFLRPCRFFFWFKCMLGNKSFSLRINKLICRQIFN